MAFGSQGSPLRIQRKNFWFQVRQVNAGGIYSDPSTPPQVPHQMLQLLLGFSLFRDNCYRVCLQTKLGSHLGGKTDIKSDQHSLLIYQILKNKLQNNLRKLLVES